MNPVNYSIVSSNYPHFKSPVEATLWPTFLSAFLESGLRFKATKLKAWVDGVYCTRKLSELNCSYPLAISIILTKSIYNMAGRYLVLTGRGVLEDSSPLQCGCLGTAGTRPACTPQTPACTLRKCCENKTEHWKCIPATINNNNNNTTIGKSILLKVD